MRSEKITFGEMRESGVFGVVVFCSDYRCSHSTALPADRWPDHIRLSDIEPEFVCETCGKRGADVRPDTRAQDKSQLVFAGHRGRSNQRKARQVLPGDRK